jgi:hypothetical protein
VALGAFAFSDGCGGDQFTPSDGGSTSDGSVSDAAIDSPPDAPPMCILPPNGVGNEGPFCQLLAQLDSRCGHCEACTQQDENDCVTLGDALSDAFKNALSACKTTLPCDTVTNTVGDGCVRAQLGATPPDATQQTVKNAYCTACPTNTEECNRFFDFTPDAGAKAGFGIWAYVLNDANAQLMISTCSQSNPPRCDALGYGLCGALILCGKVPHSHCQGGLCN